MINLRLWRQVLTWSSSARRPFRLIDRTLSAGEEYCAVALISAVIEKISHRCVFHPVLPGQLGLNCFIPSFFLLTSEGPKTFKLRLSNAIRVLEEAGLSLFADWGSAGLFLFWATALCVLLCCFFCLFFLCASWRKKKKACWTPCGHDSFAARSETFRFFF